MTHCMVLEQTINMRGVRVELRHGDAEERLTWSVAAFCRAAGISKNLFYALARQGEAPPLTRVGKRTLILQETGRAWLKGREDKGVD